MTNIEKLSIIYERMWWYTNPRKDDKTWWTIYDQNPVLIGDVLKYIDMNCCFKEPSNDWLRGRDMEALDKMLRSVFYAFVGKQDRPIEEQDDLCIEFVYNLIKK